MSGEVVLLALMAGSEATAVDGFRAQEDQRVHSFEVCSGPQQGCNHRQRLSGCLQELT